ncbi:DUF2844 domain-containing protein [Undibacterium sp. Ren11W]|uniref:DUF2844 domain-containing protein n=1 Tax=Undibacterium sp. Ren11W TaxID=3413045 RepID=UPI003BF29383
MRSLLSVFLVLICCSAKAELGAAPSAFNNKADVRKSQSLSSSVAVAPKNYRILESVLTTGTTVREYIDANGIVFAVSWNGPFLPDLQNLLGKHFDTMRTEAARVPRAGYSQLQIIRPEVSIYSGGHMRAFIGRAWIVSEFPSDFKQEDIQ